MLDLDDPLRVDACGILKLGVCSGKDLRSVDRIGSR
jgi:hypothetical protein